MEFSDVRSRAEAVAPEDPKNSLVNHEEWKVLEVVKPRKSFAYTVVSDDFVERLRSVFSDAVALPAKNAKPKLQKRQIALQDKQRNLAKKKQKREEAGSFRWKQAIRAELERAGAKGMKEKKLRKSVVSKAIAAALAATEAGAAGAGSSTDKDALEARFDSKLAKIDGCRRDGKRVFLGTQ